MLQPSTLKISGEDLANMCFTDLFTNPANLMNTNAVPSGLSQKSFQGQIGDVVYASCKNNRSIRDLAHINTISSIHAGAWLRAVPNEKLGLAFSKHKFITSIRIWLGLPLFPPHPNAQRCVCGYIIDQFGDHTLSCGSGPLRTKRDDSLRDIVWQALHTDNSGVKKQQRIGGRDFHQPGDIYHPDFTNNGKPAFFDITVRNSLQPSYIVAAATSTGAAALAGEMEIYAYHDDIVAAAGGEFFSLALETLRYRTPSSLKTIYIYIYIYEYARLFD